MATITPTVDHAYETGCILVKWVGLANNDTGLPYMACASHARKTVQVSGTTGGGTVTMNGSLWKNQEASPQWAVLRDTFGAQAITGSGLYDIEENCQQVYPTASGGDGTTSLTVRLLLREP